jgi:hypothetical protein
MSDRLFVYKTPLHRISETAVILIVALSAAALWQALIPAISPSYIIVAVLAAGIVIVPRLGSRLAEKRGAPMLTRAERTRRYLAEIGPIASPPMRFGAMGGQRRSGGRNLRRG